MNYIPLEADQILANRLNREDYSGLLIQNEISNMRRLIYSWDELDDLTKFRLITQYFEVVCNKDDVYKLINMYNGTEYSRVINIPTKMELPDHDCDGEGPNFKYWKVYKRAHYICLTTADVYKKKKVEKDKIYSREELEDLIAKKVVFPITNTTEYLDKPSRNRENYKYVRLSKSHGIEIDNFLFNIDDNGKPISDEEGFVTLTEKYFEIKISEDHIANYLSIAGKNMDKKKIMKFAYDYLDSLVKLIKKEGNDKDKINIKTINDITKNKKRARVNKTRQ